jgi:hypothetical protein
MAYKRKTTRKIKKRALTPFHREFILYYMANGHSAQNAWISAGGEPRNADVCGWQLIHINASVSAEIQRLAELAAKKNEITTTYILQGLKHVADSCSVKKVEVDEQGVAHEKGVVDSSGANRAYELLGKNQRLFIDSVEVRQASELADVSDEELLKMVKNADEKPAKHKKSNKKKK